MRFSESVCSNCFIKSLAYELIVDQMPVVISYSPFAVLKRVYYILWFAKASFPLNLHHQILTKNRESTLLQKYLT